MNEYRVVGVMSGTSLDGLDIAMCKFQKKNETWEYAIEAAKTVEYDSYWRNNLSKANELSTESFLLLNNAYGEYIGAEVNDFIKSTNSTPDIIASHGHTVFHQPEKKFTFQIGSGASILAKTKITTVSDFRTLDVALGGQGAPLVPIGDSLLFSDYQYCLNLGGFANISFIEKGKQVAFDISPCNMVINYMVKKVNLNMDKDGEIAKRGFIDQELLERLNNIPYYQLNHPKSLGKEWFDSDFISIIENAYLSFSDTLRTIYEHIAIQITNEIKREEDKVLITGGGAFNKFLVSLLNDKTKAKLVIPDDKLINFKEALIFAFLGLLKYLGKPNCLSSVTGASNDCSGGVIYKI